MTTDGFGTNDEGNTPKWPGEGDATNSDQTSPNVVDGSDVDGSDVSQSVTVSDVTVSDVAASDLTVSDVTVSDVTVSDLTVSDLTVSDLTVSDVTVSDMTVPDPDLAMPNYTVPNYSTNRAAVSDVAPHSASSDQGAPDQTASPVPANPWSRPTDLDLAGSLPRSPQPPPPPPPPVELPSAPVPPKKRNVVKILGLSLGLLGLVGGGAFAFTQITGGEKANTPEEAIESFFTSLETGDAIGMAKALVPGERDIMLDSMVPMMGELSRLDILDKSLDLNRVQGFDAKVSNFKAKSKILRPDLAEVQVTGGNIRTSVDPKKLPLGSFVRDLLGDQIDKAKVETSNDPLTGSEGSSPLVMQKVGKRWYLSINYSVAEAARRSSAEPYAVPAKGSGVAAKGADSPEAAVSEMIGAAGRFDVRRMIELLPPDEFAALHDYSGKFIGQAEEAVVEARRIAKIEVTPKLRSAKITNDRFLVSIVDLPATLNVSDQGMTVSAKYANKELSGKMTTADGEKITADYKGQCLTLVVDDETKKGCGQKGLADLFSELSGQQLDTGQLSTSGLDYGQSCVKNPKRVDFGMVTVRRDGKWFVSPTRTMLDSITASLKTLERKDLDCIKTQIEKTVNSFQGTFLPSATDSTFDSPVDPTNDPFANVDDSFNFDVLDTVPADGSDFVDDTFPADTFSTDTSPNDTVSLESDSLTFDTAVVNTSG